MGFELALDCKVVLAETPIWDPRLKKLYWTDLFEGAVHRYDPATGQDECAETRGMIGSAIPCETPGRLLVAIDDGLMLLDFATGKLEPVAAPQPNTGEFRYNDTRCDAAGRIFTSTVSKFLTEPHFDPDVMTGKFYMVDLDGAVVTLVDKLVQYNTILFDNRNENMYVVDTHNKKLLRFGYSLAKGAFGKPEVVISFDDMPDGASVDANDNLYVCHWSEKRHISVWSLKDYSSVKPSRSLSNTSAAAVLPAMICVISTWPPRSSGCQRVTRISAPARAAFSGPALMCRAFRNTSIGIKAFARKLSSEIRTHPMLNPKRRNAACMPLSSQCQPMPSSGRVW